jgi:hypothetical protein
MPSSLTAIAIAIVTLIRGVLGEFSYDVQTNMNHADKKLPTILRLMVISVGGWSSTTSVNFSARQFGWPPPSYVFPETYRGRRR